MPTDTSAQKNDDNVHLKNPSVQCTLVNHLRLIQKLFPGLQQSCLTMISASFSIEFKFLGKYVILALFKAHYFLNVQNSVCTECIFLPECFCKHF